MEKSQLAHLRSQRNKSDHHSVRRGGVLGGGGVLACGCTSTCLSESTVVTTIKNCSVWFLKVFSVLDVND